MANSADGGGGTTEATRPIRGILKATSSFDRDGHSFDKPPAEKEMKWDEMNILATHHPADKDYGHIKIDEPPTPYNRLSDGEMEEGGSGDEGENALNPEQLADSLRMKTRPKVMTEEESSDEDNEENLTEEERARRKAFAKRRKLHYNEFYAAKMARQHLDDNEEEEEEEDEESGEKMKPSGAASVEAAAHESDGEAVPSEPDKPDND